MAFNQDGLKLIAPGGTIAATYPDSGTTRNVYHYVTNDDLPTVLANGYFDPVASDPLLAGDVILATCDIDGTPLLAALAVSVGGSDVTVVAANGVVQALSTTSSTLAVAAGVITLGLSTAGGFSLGDPVPGVPVYVVQTGTSSSITLVPLTTSVFLNYTGNRTATFNAKEDAIVLVGVTATRFAVMSNVGSVSFS